MLPEGLFLQLNKSKDASRLVAEKPEPLAQQGKEGETTQKNWKRFLRLSWLTKAPELLNS